MTMFEIFNKRSDKFSHLFNKNQTLLLKSQIREIKKITEECFFLPSEFTLYQIESIQSNDYGVLVNAISFQDSSFHFIFDVKPEVGKIDLLSQMPDRIDFKPYAIFSPGKETSQEKSYSESWEKQKEAFKAWLTYLKREVTEDDIIDDKGSNEEGIDTQVMSTENEAAKPKIFIGSSVEGLKFTYAIQEELEHDADSIIWSQGIFKLSGNTLQDLVKVLDKSDFGIFVFSPDDVTIMRQKEVTAVRDNVIFEFGMFIGRLGSERVFFVLPSGQEIHLPTDLLGINPGTFKAHRPDDELRSALGPFCNKVRTQIKSLGMIYRDNSKKKL